MGKRGNGKVNKKRSTLEREIRQLKQDIRKLNDEANEYVDELAGYIVRRHTIVRRYNAMLLENQRLKAALEGAA